MKKLKYNENTREIDVVEEERRTIKVKNFIERYKVFIEIFSTILTIFMSGMVAYVGYEVNARNAETNKRQLEIAENDRKPRFVIKRNLLPDNIRLPDDMEKVPRYSYTITNEGGDISEVLLYPESYIYFYVPTNIEGEYYIFKCLSHDFEVGGAGSVPMLEKDKVFSFDEYVLKDDDISEWEALGKCVSEYFPDMKYTHKNFVKICYTDYMGEEQEKLFEFNDSYVKKLSDEKGCIPLKAGLDYSLGEVPEIEETAEKVKKEIEDWLEKNKDSKGHKIPPGTWFRY